MKKILIASSIVLLIIGLGLIIFLVRPDNVPNLQEMECKIDAECAKGLFSSDELAIYPPCFRGKCENPKNSEEWIEYCNLAGSNARSTYTWNCYMNAVYDSLRKYYRMGENTINWDEAFGICEKYIPEDEERCKIETCNNLNLGNVKIKYDYPKYKECYRQARINTNCNDGEKNGGETDVDCGGDCQPCNNSKQCFTDEDCTSNNCSSGYFRCYDTCPNELISKNKPCNCGAVSFDSDTPEIPIGIYCCEGKTQRTACD